MVASCGYGPATTATASTPTTTTPTAVTVSHDPTPASDPTPAPSTPPAAHACGPATITVVKGNQPAPICLTAGTDLRITSGPSHLQPWSPLTSSDPTILDCSTTTGPDGSITATCHARRAGIATLSTITAPFAGDPHGPAQYRWQITVTVHTA
jgi:hypothetical protein